MGTGKMPSHKVYINGECIGNVMDFESFHEMAKMASEEIRRETNRIKLDNFIKSTLYDTMASMKGRPIGMGGISFTGAMSAQDRAMHRILRDSVYGACKPKGGVTMKVMKIQDLMKPENHDKEFVSGDHLKYKFDGKKLLVWSDFYGWGDSHEKFNTLLDWEFTEIKKPYTFIEALNDRTHKYYPENDENYTLGIHLNGSVILARGTTFTELTTATINGNWFRR